MRNNEANGNPERERGGAAVTVGAAKGSALQGRLLVVERKFHFLHVIRTKVRRDIFYCS